MNGYQITFFTVQGHRYKEQPIGDWLVHLAKEMGLTGATLIAVGEGFGHHRRIHSARFIELTDQPQEVVMVTTTEEADRLFERLKSEGVHLFYAKTACGVRHPGRGREIDRIRSCLRWMAVSSNSLRTGHVSTRAPYRNGCDSPAPGNFALNL